MTSKDIVLAIIDDMCDRSALGNAWEEIDPDIQEEIISDWIDIVSGAE